MTSKDYVDLEALRIFNGINNKMHKLVTKLSQINSVHPTCRDQAESKKGYRVTDQILLGASPVHNLDEVPKFGCSIRYDYDRETIEKLVSKNNDGLMGIDSFVTMRDAQILFSRKLHKPWKDRKDLRQYLITNVDTPRAGDLRTSICLGDLINNSFLNYLNQTKYENTKVVDALVLIPEHELLSTFYMPQLAFFRREHLTYHATLINGTILNNFSYLTMRSPRVSIPLFSAENYTADWDIESTPKISELSLAPSGSSLGHILLILTPIERVREKVVHRNKQIYLASGKPYIDFWGLICDKFEEFPYLTQYPEQIKPSDSFHSSIKASYDAPILSSHGEPVIYHILFTKVNPYKIEDVNSQLHRALAASDRFRYLQRPPEDTPARKVS